MECPEPEWGVTRRQNSEGGRPEPGDHWMRAQTLVLHLLCAGHC